MSVSPGTSQRSGSGSWRLHVSLAKERSCLKTPSSFLRRSLVLTSVGEKGNCWSKSREERPVRKHGDREVETNLEKPLH